MAQFIIVYREHNKLNIDTKYYGTFKTYGEAYDYLCTLPAIGAYTGYGLAGCKFVQELTTMLYI